MNEGAVPAKDFQIKLLQDQLTGRDREIERLNKCLETVVYFAIVSIDLLEKSRHTILAASRGEIEKPVLRLANEEFEKQ